MFVDGKVVVCMMIEMLERSSFPLNWKDAFASLFVLFEPDLVQYLYLSSCSYFCPAPSDTLDRSCLFPHTHTHTWPDLPTLLTNLDQSILQTRLTNTCLLSQTRLIDLTHRCVLPLKVLSNFSSRVSQRHSWTIQPIPAYNVSHRAALDQSHLPPEIFLTKPTTSWRWCLW